MSPEMEMLKWLLALGVAPFVAVGVVRWWYNGRKLTSYEEDLYINELKDKMK